jgi:hypothetical protein
MAEHVLGLIGVLVFTILTFRENSILGSLVVIVEWSLFVEVWAPATVSSPVDG